MKIVLVNKQIAYTQVKLRDDKDLQVEVTIPNEHGFTGMFKEGEDYEIIFKRLDSEGETNLDTRINYSTDEQL